MSCKPAVFSGLGECKKLMDKMNGMVLYKKGTTFTSTTALDLSVVRTKIADDEFANRTATALPIMSFENTTDDISILTTQLGRKITDGKPIPSGVIYLDASMCDYKAINELEDIVLEAEPYFQDGTKWLSIKSDGTYKPFKVRLSTKFGLPPEDKTQSYPVYLFFESYQEFEDVVVVSPEYTFNDVLDIVPVGLSMSIVTAYTGGNVVVKVTERCKPDVGVTGLTSATDFPVISSNGSPVVAVTSVVENGQGQYTLTIKTDSGGTPANLASSEYATIQAQDDDGTYATYLSQPVKVIGGA